MSTHNIGFYVDLTKIIFELSSNVIKYTPYFFCCGHVGNLKENKIISEHCREKACLRGFRPGLTQTRMYIHRRWLKAANFGFRKKSDCIIYVSM